ncbi:hypothetical protein E2C01_001788 [Portunus trituberculatus]|uniref:Uncharacterized protein n=1 Tax=Portunus trituberculatus TaxID=210409 RepID=A0A5B7CIU4_PORTR|nr:hypothetical protein [Portunus trituberculatus]
MVEFHKVGSAGDMGNKPGTQSQSEEETEVVPAARVPPLTSHPDSASGPSRSLSVENGEEGELEMELPPPMKVLEQPTAVAAAQGGQGTAAAASGPPMPPLDNILTDVPTRVWCLVSKVWETSGIKDMGVEDLAVAMR